MIADLIDIRVDYTYSMVQDVIIAIGTIHCCFVVDTCCWYPCSTT